MTDRTPDTFESLKKRWRETAATDRKENAELNVRLQRGEIVTIKTVPGEKHSDKCPMRRREEHPNAEQKALDKLAGKPRTTL